MERWIAGLIAISSLVGCAPSSEVGSLERADFSTRVPSPDDQGPSMVEFAGPGIFCGLAFAIKLRPGERLERNDPGIDFLTYSTTGGPDEFLLYEGNAPQPSDRTIETGMDFPSVIAIHLRPGASLEAVEPRVLTRDEKQRVCTGWKDGDEG